MFKIAVCDDEKYFQSRIKEILTAYQKEKNISHASSPKERAIPGNPEDTQYEIDTFDSGKEFLDLGTDIRQYKIIFLDINMEELDGILTAKKIRELDEDAFIVFVTAFAKYSFEGYKVDAVRYILKDNETLSFSIFESMDAIFKKIYRKSIWKEFNFTVGRRKIFSDHILYIESRLHRLEFHMLQEDSFVYTLYGTLNQLEQELAESEFLRIHQSYLVNMKYIAAVSRYDALLSDGTRLEIPKARYKSVEERFCTYKGEI